MQLPTILNIAKRLIFSRLYSVMNVVLFNKIVPMDLKKKERYAKAKALFYE